MSITFGPPELPCVDEAESHPAKVVYIDELLAVQCENGIVTLDLGTKHERIPSAARQQTIVAARLRMSRQTGLNLLDKLGGAISDEA